MFGSEEVGSPVGFFTVERLEVKPSFAQRKKEEEEGNHSGWVSYDCSRLQSETFILDTLRERERGGEVLLVKVNCQNKGGSVKYQKILWLIYFF